VGDEITLDEGKYHFYIKDYSLYCDRYGEKWREFIGDNAVHSLFDLCIMLSKKGMDRELWDLIKEHSNWSFQAGMACGKGDQKEYSLLIDHQDAILKKIKLHLKGK